MFPADWKVYGNKDVLAAAQSVAFSVGNFDGVHAGHEYLLRELKKIAAGRPTVVMTFEPHPRKLFLPETKGMLLASVEDRVRTILENGVDVVLVQNFSKAFSELSASDFCSDFLLKNLNISKILFGFDFRFGFKRAGDFDFMRTLAADSGVEVFREDPFVLNGVAVSSSEIRRLISCGDVQGAKALMTRPFAVSGQVVRGDQRGRLLGFPTVNLGGYSEDLLMPMPGVYAGFVELERDGALRPSVMSFGVRPTFGAHLEYRAEAHIFDFAADVYGKSVRFSVEHRLRGEEKFADVEALKAQMVRDSERARFLLG
jgi:riboflavin kinase/FMN adenylyltransferase